MITLFIDTHSSFAIMALYKDEKLWLKKEIDGQQNHSSICMPSLVSLLEEAQINLDDISDIVVVIGPGSFTGVRLGVTIAKTIAYTKNIPIRTLTSLELFLNSSLIFLSCTKYFLLLCSLFTILFKVLLFFLFLPIIIYSSVPIIGNIIKIIIHGKV